MKEENELKFVANAFVTWLTKIQMDKAVGFNDKSIASEDVALQILNLIYCLELRNLNLTESKRADAIDLGDKSMGIAYQVSTSHLGSKIKTNLQLFVKNNLIAEYPNGIRFLILSHLPVKHPKGGYANILVGFNKTKHILTYKDLLKKVREIYSTDNVRFEKIKEVLDREIFAQHEPTNNAPIDEMVVIHKPLSISEKMKLLQEKNEYESEIRSYFMDTNRAVRDYEKETSQIIPMVENIIKKFGESKTYFYRDSNPNDGITAIEHHSKIALQFRWDNIDNLKYFRQGELNLSLTCGIYNADGFVNNKFPNYDFNLVPLQTITYNFHLGKSKTLGWREAERPDDHLTTEGIVETWHNQLLNRLVF